MFSGFGIAVFSLFIFCALIGTSQPQHKQLLWPAQVNTLPQ